MEIQGFGFLRDILFVVVPKFISSISIFALNLFLIRKLSLSNYGVFSFCITVMLLMDSLIGSALDVAVLRSVTVAPEDRQPDSLAPSELAAFTVKLLFGAICAVLGLMIGESLGHRAFQQPGGSLLLVTATASGTMLMLFRSLLVHCQINQRFRIYGALDFCQVIARAGLVLAALAAGVRQPVAFVALYGLAALSVVIFGRPFVIRIPALSRTFDLGLCLPLLSHAREVLKVFGAGTATSKLEILVIGIAANPKELGLYCAGMTVAIIPELLGGYISTVFAPKIISCCRIGIFSAFYRRVTVVIYEAR